MPKIQKPNGVKNRKGYIMPYSKFTKVIEGRKKWCTRKLSDGKVTCFKSPEARKTGIRIRMAIDHGWKPTKK